MNIFDLSATISLTTIAYENGLNAARNATNNFGTASNKILNAVKAAGAAALTATSAAAIKFGKDAITAGMNFDAAMSKVSAISGATGKDFDALRDKAQEMGAKTKFSATESANAFEYMAMAGWKTEDMLGGIEGIMNLAAASGEDLANTSDIVTDAITAFGLSAKDSGHFADILAAASSNANTNVSMMGETFKYAAPVAGAFGFSAEDTAEAIGLMANSGIKASQAGTSLRYILTQMSGPLKISGSSIGEVAIQTQNADGTMRSLTDILDDCRYYFGHLTEAEKSNAAESIAGKNAMSGFLALMNAAPNDVDKVRNSIENCDGAAANMADTMQDNLAGDITIFKSALEGLQIVLSDKVSPALRAFTQEGITQISNLTKNIKDKGLISAFEEIPGIIAKATTKVITVGTDIINNLAKGIREKLPALIPTAMETLVKFSDGLRTNIGKIVDAGLNLIKSLAQSLIDNIPTLIKTVPTIISNLAGVINDNAPKILNTGIEIIAQLIKGIIKAIPTLVQEAPKIIKAIVDVWTAFNWLALGKNAINLIKSGIVALKNTLPNALKNIGTNAMNLFRSVDWAGLGQKVISLIYKGITTVIDKLPSILKSIGKSAILAFQQVDWAGVGKKAITLIANAAKGAFELAKTALKYVGDKAKEAFSSIDWKSLGENLLKGIANGIKNGLHIVSDAAKEAAKSALDAAKSFLGIHSPSTVAEKKVGVPYVQGIAKGIKESKKYAEKSAQEVGEAILSASEKNLSNQKVYYKVSLQQEKEYWDAVRKEIKKGTQARIDADQKYYEAAQNLKEARAEAKTQASTLTKEYTKAYKQVELDLAEQRSKLSKQLLEDLKSVDESLDAEIDKLNQDYENAVKSRKNTIAGFFSLFSDVGESEGETVGNLIGNLAKQIDTMKEWDSVLNSLGKRLGETSPLFEELQGMGIDSLGTLKSLNQMTDQELQYYSRLYDEKNAIAEQRAKKENEMLLASTRQSIESAKKTAQQERDTLKNENEKNLAQLQKDAKKQMETLTSDYTKSIQSLAKECGAQGQSVGQSMIEGIEKGLSASSKSLTAASTSVIQGMIDATQASLTQGLSVQTAMLQTSSALAQSALLSTQNALTQSLASQNSMLQQMVANVKSAASNTSAVQSAISNPTTTTAYTGEKNTGISQFADDFKKSIKEAAEALGNTKITLNGREVGRVVRQYA